MCKIVSFQINAITWQILLINTQVTQKLILVTKQAGAHLVTFPLVLLFSAYESLNGSFLSQTKASKVW